MISNQVVFSGTLVFGNHALVQRRSGSVVIDIVCLSLKSDPVAIDSKTASSNLCGFDSDNGDESENKYVP